jgi:hydrogenase maturation factor
MVGMNMSDGERILLAHGGGGQLSRELIDREIVSRFGTGPLKGLPDGATVPVEGDKLETLMGGHRLVDVPRGELLPRIC